MSDIDTLREKLFATLDGLRDNSVSVEKARAINETAQVLVNCAKIEIDYLRLPGVKAQSRFLPQSAPAAIPTAQVTETPGAQHTATGTKTVVLAAGGGVTTHRMR